jgi:hypothetical protein
MPPRRAANVLDVVWRGTGPTRYGGTDARWQRQVAYDAAEKHHFRTVLNKGCNRAMDALVIDRRTSVYYQREVQRRAAEHQLATDSRERCVGSGSFACGSFILAVHCVPVELPCCTPK